MTVWIQNPFDNLPSEGYRKERYWLMCEAFVRAGHDVVFWTSSFSHAKKAFRRLDVQPFSRLEVRMIPTLPYPKNVCFKRIESHRAYAKEWNRLSRDAGKPDIIVTSTPTLSAAAVALDLGRKYGAKVVVDVMDAWPETFERLAPKGLRWLTKPFLLGMHRMARRIYREADLVTGVCERYRELTGRSDYYLAYHGIDLSLQSPVFCPQPHNTTQRVRLVYAGNLGKTYDLRTVVNAVEANGDFELDVAGFGNFHSDCSRVRFHGLLSEPDLQALLAQCDIGIVPMRADSWVGVPYKFCDYSKAGLAIVSSLGGESSALLGKYRCGVTYRAGDPSSLAVAIRKAMTLRRGASRTMCADEFDATKIYDAYAAHVLKFVQNS